MIDPGQTAFTYTTYSAFCAKVRRIAVPAGVGETQKPLFDTLVINALIRAQKYVDCLRKIQVSVFDKDQMFENCGVANFVPPRGKINLIYAFKPDEACLKHIYHPATLAQIHCWSQENNCGWETVPPGVGTEEYARASDICYDFSQLYPGQEEADDCWKCAPKWMARGRNGEVYLAPRLPCGYLIAVHWEGLKRTWAALDPVPDDEDLADWVAQYVQSEMTLRSDRDIQLSRELKANAAEKFGDIMYWCNEERRLQIDIDCAQGIDTGNLIDMFFGVYPYNASPPAEPDGGGGGPDPEPEVPAQDGLKISDADYLVQEDDFYILLEQGGSAKVGDLPEDTAPADSVGIPIVHDPAGTPANERMSPVAFFDSAQSLDAAVTPDLTWEVPILSDPNGTPTIMRVTLQAIYDFLEQIGSVLPDGIWAQYNPKGSGDANASGFPQFSDWLLAPNTYLVPSGTADGFDRFVGNTANTGPELQEYFLLDRTPRLDAHLSWFRGSQRMFAGFISDTAVWNSDTPAGDFIGFVASVPRGDTTIWCLCRTASSETRVNTGLSYSSAVWRRYQVEYDPTAGTATFTVDGVVVATISTNIPSHTTAMKCICACKNTGTDILDVSRITFTTLR